MNTTNHNTKIDESIKDHYLKLIKPKETNFEEKRKKVLSSINNRIIISILASIIFIAVLCVKFELDYLSLAIFSSVIISLCYSWCNAPKKKYVGKVKEEIFPLIFKAFEKLDYSPKVDIDLRALKNNSEIIPEYDKAILANQVRGEIDDVSVTIFEANLIEIRHDINDRHRSHESEVFKGLIVSLDMNKQFSAKTIVKTDKGKVGNMFGRTLSKCENVRLENPDFEKKFEVYSSDQVEARYLLTTRFMERILELSDLFGAMIECSFFDKKLLIIIETERELFDISDIKRPVDFSRDIDIVLEEIRMIEKIIHTLNLHKKTGL